MENLFILLVVLASFLSGYFLRFFLAKFLRGSAEKKAEELLSQAEEKRKEIILEAKEKAIKIIEEVKKEEGERQKELKETERQLRERQVIFEKKLIDLEGKRAELQKEINLINEAKEKIKKLHEEAVVTLQKVAQMTTEEAKEKLFESLEKKYQEDILTRLKKLEEHGAEEIKKKAQQMIIEVMERLTQLVVIENSSTSISLPSDEIKGRIIGREGRNIKVIENLTGTEIIVDDTPEAIFVSSFNPLRRQLAKIALEKLIADGRIQPARIERVIEDSKKELAEEIKKAGEEAVYSLGLTGLDPKIVNLIGRLKFRTSYGQNMLTHSIEVARLSEMLAVELGASPVVAKKAGFLHDLGKAVDFEVQGTHPELGKELALKYNLGEEIIIPIATHHEDHPPTLEAVIVKVADAISSSRPGARNIDYEEYLKRLEELEEIAKSEKGVEKAYAIQAGRELRVFVKPEEADDLACKKMAQAIVKRIEEELKYPGEIRVTVIRENRVIEYAR